MVEVFDGVQSFGGIEKEIGEGLDVARGRFDAVSDVVIRVVVFSGSFFATKA